MSFVPALIPAQERRIILEQQIIEKAVAIHTNEQMKHLMIVWKQYVEPTLEADCGLCFERIIKNWKAIHPQLIDLEKSDNLLNSV